MAKTEDIRQIVALGGGGFSMELALAGRTVESRLEPFYFGRQP